jgi:tripartite-type tricarboxylate transporter receptor subunit TctC
MKLLRILSLLVVALGTVAAEAQAQAYPTKPIRILVPFAPGGSIDVLARLLSPRMAEELGQPVIVENRPGAGGRIAPEAVAKSAPDGYTILISSNFLAVMPALYKKGSFDPRRDLAPLSQLISTELILVATPKLEVNNLKEFIAFAKAKPGVLNHASTGVASQLHLTMEVIKSLAGIDVVQIPYKGDGPALSALLSGEVSVAVLPISTVSLQVKTGRLRPIAVTGTTRSAALPEVPTIIESGLPGVDMAGWMSFFAPAGTPGPILPRVQQAAAKALAAPEVRERLPALGQIPVGSTPEQFEAKYKADVEAFQRIVADAKIAPQD